MQTTDTPKTQTAPVNGKETEAIKVPGGKWEVRNDAPASAQQQSEAQMQAQYEAYGQTRPEDMRHSQGEAPYYPRPNDFMPIFEMAIPLTLFIVGGFILVRFIAARHAERMAIIDRGLDPQQYRHLYKSIQFSASPFAALKWGMVAIFIGIGFLLGNIIETVFPQLNEDVLYITLMLICGGAGLLFYYGIVSKKMKNENTETKKMEMMEV